MTRTLSVNIISNQRRNKQSLIGDIGDELAISLINQRLDAQHKVYYCDVKADVQDIYNQTHRTHSSGPACSTIGNSTVQRILNRANLSVKPARTTKQRDGDNTHIDTFRQLVKQKLQQYDLQYVLNIDETQLTPVPHNHQTIRSAHSTVKSDTNKHNATAMMCGISTT